MFYLTNFLSRKFDGRKYSSNVKQKYSKTPFDKDRPDKLKVQYSIEIETKMKIENILPM